jgi:CDP-glucose 4,6-dehydratase
MNELFKDIYKGQRVLVTGHTGFKGSWLSLWLTSLGAEVIGVSLDPPTSPSNFEVIGLKDRINHLRCDTRNFDDLRKIFDACQPAIVFHLAAQAIVRNSYDHPKLTFETNLGGIVNILECIRVTSCVKAGVMITSDKCYQNLEWTWGYRENDRLGGDDPYSASKACAEMACHAYFKSFFSKSPNRHPARLATARAGNVIGGGDWAPARIVPDCVRAWANHEEVVIRSPEATRPWQHVLEPLSGYLWLGAKLFQSDELHAESFNFGPDQKVNRSVRELIEVFLSHWDGGTWRHDNTKIKKHENTLLKLTCDKALHHLHWHAVLSFEETVRMTAEWYREYYARTQDMGQFAARQIEAYVTRAKQLRLAWAGVE